MKFGIKVRYGLCECSHPLDGKKVHYVRQALSNLLNISTDARALINGNLITLLEEETVLLQAGDIVDFIKSSGAKGLGDLITEVELLTRWRLNEGQLQELIRLGLPKLQLKDGSTWFSEIAIDEWCRQTVLNDLTQPPHHSSWCHRGNELPPTGYHGPLVGTQKQLASWLYSDGKPDPRRLKARSATGRIWVKRNTGQEYEVWFKSQQEYAEANSRRLRHHQG